MINEFPQYQHDCDECLFLGRFKGNDLYYHPSDNWPTVIARHGDDGPDYISGFAFCRTVPELSEALFRAAERGLIAPKPKNQQTQ